VKSDGTLEPLWSVRQVLPPSLIDLLDSPECEDDDEENNDDGLNDYNDCWITEMMINNYILSTMVSVCVFICLPFMVAASLAAFEKLNIHF